MEKKLKKPPIIEAICEFKFDDKFEDLIVYGSLHEKFKNNYPKTKKTTNLDLVLEKTDDGFQHRTIEHNLQRFISEDGKSLLQVGPNILTVNRLKPYESWESFFPKIKSALNIFLDITKLKKLKRIGLRFINKINLKETEIKLEDYYNFRPMGDTLCDEINSFIVGIQILKEKDILKVTLTNSPPDQDFKMAHSLDLDYFSTNFNDENINDAMDWIHNAHEEIENAFFNCITDKLKKEFEG